MNKVIMLGRLTADPKTTMNQDGQATSSRFGLAVDRSYKRDGQPTVDFFNCVAFGRTADFVQKYLAKGRQIAIVGRLQTGKYTNRDGVDINTVDIVVEEVNFADSKPSAASGENAQSANNETAPSSNYSRGFGSQYNGAGSQSSNNVAAPSSNGYSQRGFGSQYNGTGGAGSQDGFMNIPDDMPDDLPF